MLHLGGSSLHPLLSLIHTIRYGAYDCFTSKAVVPTHHQRCVHSSAPSDQVSGLHLEIFIDDVDAEALGGGQEGVDAVAAEVSKSTGAHVAESVGRKVSGVAGDELASLRCTEFRLSLHLSSRSFQPNLSPPIIIPYATKNYSPHSSIHFHSAASHPARHLREGEGGGEVCRWFFAVHDGRCLAPRNGDGDADRSLGA